MHNSSRWITNFALVLFLIGVTLHVRQLLIEWRFLREAAKLGIQTSPFFGQLQIFFISAFIVSLAGLLFRRRRGIVISVTGLLFVLLGYAAWRAFTLRQMRLTLGDPFFTTHPEFVPDHTLGLIGAHWWDFGTLLGCLILLAWYVTVLRKPRLKLND